MSAQTNTHRRGSQSDVKRCHLWEEWSKGANRSTGQRRGIVHGELYGEDELPLAP